MFLRRFKWYQKIDNFFQRGKKGYCNEDLWDLYEWFTNLFPKMLEDFLQNSNGYPINGYPPEGENEEFWYKEQQRKWEYEVKKLIWNLREANDGTCSQKNEIEYDVKFDFEKENDNQIWYKLNLNFPTEEDAEKYQQHIERDKEITNYKKECFNKALQQFEKIARSLWD